MHSFEEKKKKKEQDVDQHNKYGKHSYFTFLINKFFCYLGYFVNFPCSNMSYFLLVKDHDNFFTKKIHEIRRKLP